MNAFRFLLPVLVCGALAGCATTSVPPAAEPPHPKEAEHLAVLANSTDLQARARACQELGVVGGSAAVAPLAALLGVEHLSDYARSGLEGIRDPAAGEALRRALPQLQGRYLAGAVNSLGVRRDRAAVSDLQRLALDPARGAAADAVAALGLIATPDAAEALQKVLAEGAAETKAAAAHAALAAAERLNREGQAGVARRLLESAVKAVPEGPAATAARSRLAVASDRR